MNRSTHLVEQEEVMAYLDGELEPQRAATVAAHIDACPNCRALAAELRSVSQQMVAWQVEPAPARLSERVTAAIEGPTRKENRPAGKQLPAVSRLHGWLMSRWVWGLASASVALLIIAKLTAPAFFEVRKMPSSSAEVSHGTVDVNNSNRREPQSDTLRSLAGGGGGDRKELTAGPMIARTASLTIVAKDFEVARAAVERIVSQHKGYVADLATNAPKDAARTLTATLRIPAPQLDAAIADLKALGRVEQETQSGEDVTKQYADLVARLNNSRAAEKRLVDILQQRTGKVSEVLEVEQEIARVREEIEQMEAERKNTEKRVEFASLQLRLSEEYKARLEMTPPATGTRLRNAVVSGYQRVSESIFETTLFVLDYGPSFLFWVLLLYWPGRFAWRRWRTAHATSMGSSVGAP